MFSNRLKRKDLSNKYDYYHAKNKISDKKYRCPLKLICEFAIFVSRIAIFV